ncbi:IclR family transcriptional regulator [Halorubrum vacuolatum]|nr:IclR family transcriptional regulator [Halorubrum vacuolatum]
MGPQSQILQTTEQSIQILQVVKDEKDISVEQIASKVGISKSTAYKHVATLKKHGLISGVGGQYSLGARLFSLGISARNGKREFRKAEKYTNKLSDTTSEDAEFGVENSGRVVTLYESTVGSEQSSLGSDYTQYMHSTAIGKCILSTYTDDRINLIISDQGLPEKTENTITDLGKLMEEIKTVREQGYAINDQESKSGKRVAGVPVEIPDLNMVGGFCVSGPEYRVDDHKLHNVFPRELNKIGTSRMT